MLEAARLSHTAALVLKTVKEGYSYGFDIMAVTGLPSGTIYPALRRMEHEGFVEGTWEDAGKALREERPARRYYKITDAGRVALKDAERRYPLIAQFARPKKVKA